MAAARALRSQTAAPALTGMGGSGSGSNFCEALPFRVEFASRHVAHKALVTIEASKAYPELCHTALALDKVIHLFVHLFPSILKF